MTFSSPADAQDAIDNMDLNELRGKVLRVNLARPTKMPLQPQGNKASKLADHCPRAPSAHWPPLQSGNQKTGLNDMPSRSLKVVVRLPPYLMGLPRFAQSWQIVIGAALRAQVRGGSHSTPEPNEEGQDEPMQE